VLTGLVQASQVFAQASATLHFVQMPPSRPTPERPAVPAQSSDQRRMQDLETQNATLQKIIDTQNEKIKLLETRIADLEARKK
jgi:polyhydroxyalkanoate synthesis regulator phasin